MNPQFVRLHYPRYRRYDILFGLTVLPPHAQAARNHGLYPAPEHDNLSAMRRADLACNRSM